MKRVSNAVTYVFLGICCTVKLYTVSGAGVFSTHSNEILRAKNGWFQDSGVAITLVFFALAAYEVKEGEIGRARFIFIALLLLEFWWLPISFKIFDYFLWRGL